MGRPGQGTSITTWIVAAVAIIVAIALVALIYGRVVGGLGAVGTAQVTATVIPGGLQIEVDAVGGGVTVQGIVVLDPSGNVLYAAGKTPYGSSSSSSYYSLKGIYIGGTTLTSIPFSLANGQSATIVLSGSPSGTTPATVLIYYNNGKTAQATVSS